MLPIKGGGEQVSAGVRLVMRLRWLLETRHYAHLKEAVIAKKKGGAIDAKVENTVMTRGNVQAHSRCNKLHSLAALNLQHPAHRSNHDLHGTTVSKTACLHHCRLQQTFLQMCNIHHKPSLIPDLCKSSSSMTSIPKAVLSRTPQQGDVKMRGSQWSPDNHCRLLS